MTGSQDQIEKAANWLATNWESAVLGAALTAQLRQRFGLEFCDAVKAIAEAKRLRGDK